MRLVNCRTHRGSSQNKNRKESLSLSILAILCRSVSSSSHEHLRLGLASTPTRITAKSYHNVNAPPKILAILCRKVDGLPYRQRCFSRAYPIATPADCPTHV